MGEMNTLGFLKAKCPSFKEQRARVTLKNVRAEGHSYVELREESNKSFIFFCTLCLAPCYGDAALFAHLKGNLHSKRRASAKLTLLVSNPWPFNDGIHFFDNSREEDSTELVFVSPEHRSRLTDIDTHSNNNNLALVEYNATGDGNLGAGEADSDLEGCSVEKNGRIDDAYMNCHVDSSDEDGRTNGCKINSGGKNDIEDFSFMEFIVPGVLYYDKISELKLRYVGLGQISARYRVKGSNSNEIARIWCEWLGKKRVEDSSKYPVPEHDYAVVTFRYRNDIGLVSFVQNLLCASPDEGSGKKRKKLLTEAENVSYHCSSLQEDMLDSIDLDERLLPEGQSLCKDIISDKSVRRELRREQRVAANKVCDICQHKMLPGKDVATILNFNTGKFACSSRNGNGNFHVFHVSCLIHWILWLEYEMLTYGQSTTSTNQHVDLKGSPKSKGKGKGKRKCNKKEMVGKLKFRGCLKHPSSVFCPECHGNGIVVEGDKLQRPRYINHELFKYKIKAMEAHKAWMTNPELLPNCSTGFYFLPLHAGDTTQMQRLLVCRTFRTLQVFQRNLQALQGFLQELSGTLPCIIILKSFGAYWKHSSHARHLCKINSYNRYNPSSYFNG